MARKSSKVPMPRSDPRSNAISTSDAMDVKDHPAYNKPDATEHYDRTIRSFGDLYDAIGPKAAYRAETDQMNAAVGISEVLGDRFDR